MPLFRHFCFYLSSVLQVVKFRPKKVNWINYLHVGEVSKGSEHSSLDVCNINALQAAVNNILLIKHNINSIVEEQT